MTGRGRPGHDHRVTATLAAPGVAVVMPVRDQAPDLPGTVTRVLETLEHAEHRATVIIVDDGSTDGTPDVADELARECPTKIVVVRHRDRRGHRAAVRSGIDAALDTEHATVVLTEAGGRFRAEDLPRLVADATTERADVVLGHRQDSGVPRGLLSRPAHRDPDCSCAVVSRAVLERYGRGLAGQDERPVGRDLAVCAHDDGARVVHRALDSGSEITRSPAPLRARPRPGALRNRPGRSRRRGGDPVLRLVTVLASLASVASFVVSLVTNAVLTYPDAVAHLLIARRVVDSPTAGPAQLGGVWLPLTHLVAAPAAAVDLLFRSGAAGSLVSMVSYVLAIRWTYTIVKELTADRTGAVTAAAVIGLCPNVLYMQSTPMSEMPFLCGIAGATYFLVVWVRTQRHRDLAVAGAALLLVSLVRYEAWPFCLAALGVVAVEAWRRSNGSPWRRRLLATEAHLVYASLLGLAGIAGWIVWNAAIFRNPFFFFDGEYSDSSIWVGPEELTAGNLDVTLLTWWYAVVDNVGVPLTLAGLVGLLVLVVRTRLRGAALAAAVPLVLLPFFLVVLYAGQRTIHVTEIGGDRNNVRFGLVMIVPLAIGVGYAMGQVSRLRRSATRVVAGLSVVAVVVVGIASTVVSSGGVATLAEARVFRAAPFEQGNAGAAAWLRSNYRGGTMLMNNFGNQTVAFDSGIPTGDIVHDGSFGLWRPALANPAANGIEWIYMRSGSSYPDPVWAELSDSPRLAPYRLVYDADDRRIYHLEAGR